MVARILNVMRAFVLLLAMAFAVSANAEPIRVESRVSWSTPAQPELHLLLRNAESVPIEFLLEWGSGEHKDGVRCETDLSSLDRSFTWRFSRWSGISPPLSRGVVPANGWAHRALLLGSMGLVPPCEIDYHLTLSKDGERTYKVLSGTIAVGGRTRPERGSVSPDRIDSEAMFERDEIHRDQLVARILLRNKEPHEVELLVTDRRVSCGDNALSWALHRGAVQGEDVGPVSIPAAGWAVLAMALRTAISGPLPDRCELAVELSADTGSEIQPLEWVRLRPEITGFLAGRHRQDGDPSPKARSPE